MHLKTSFVKWRPFCLGLNVLNPIILGTEGQFSISVGNLKSDHLNFAIFFIECHSVLYGLIGFGDSLKPHRRQANLSKQLSCSAMHRRVIKSERVNK